MNTSASSRVPGRSRVRWVPLLLGVVAPLCELAVIVGVGSQIGAGWTVLALLAGVVVGFSVIASQGRKAASALRGAVADGRSRGRELGDGALLVLAGVLFVLPGFLGDLVALALFLPPVRALARRVLGALFATTFVAVPGAGRFTAAGFGGHTVVDGEVVDPTRHDPRAQASDPTGHGDGPTVIEGRVIER